jgi:hypothetical protein
MHASPPTTSLPAASLSWLAPKKGSWRAPTSATRLLRMVEKGYPGDANKQGTFAPHSCQLLQSPSNPAIDVMSYCWP